MMWSENLSSNKILMMKEMRMSWSSNMKKKNRMTKKNVLMTKMRMKKNLNFFDEGDDNETNEEVVEMEKLLQHEDDE
jgi:hypothetical protein